MSQVREFFSRQPREEVVEIEEIKNLIRFHQAGLDQYRQHMSPSAQYGEEQTIKALKELEKRIESDGQ